MSSRKELCRNFQRGSCSYGDRCRYLHVTQQQSKPNPFGFGTGSTSHFQSANQQQQQPNPFGFGVQSGSQSKGASPFGSRYQSNAQKPFENKWTRSANSKPEQADTQARAANHKCTDPEECKRLIVEDLTNERPLWKLTCYAHFKGLPCDISGDISYEELRAVAYEDARQGINLQFIVERERNLLNSKLIEFDKLVQNPYVISQSHTSGDVGTFNKNSFPQSTQNNVPSQSISFGQSGLSINPGINIRPSPANSVFGQPSPFQSSLQMGPTTPGTFGGQLPKQDFGGSPGPGTFGGQLPRQNFGGSPRPNVPIFSSGFGAAQSNSFSSNISSQSFNSIGGSEIVSTSANQTSIDSMANEKEGGTTDTSIWLKEKWTVKEIPEEEPPLRFCM